jgi:ribose 5-phosphate isomerase A
MEELKRAAAYEAVERYVKDGMVLGLGSGTTSSWVIRRTGELLASGELRDVRGIPTSEDTATLAQDVGVSLVSLVEDRPDLTIDGADEIDPDLNLIKGLGGALLREKIVAAASRDGLVIVADGSKSVDVLGDGGPLPVEVEPFGWESTLDALASLGCGPKLRLAKPQPFVTDGGHYTIDCLFPGITEPASLEAEIKRIPGALECGLFVGLAKAAVIARGEAEGETEVIEA